MCDCTHKAVLEILLGENDDFWNCLVGHFKEDGSKAPQCIRCSDCNRWVGWEIQEAMLKSV